MEGSEIMSPAIWHWWRLLAGPEELQQGLERHFHVFGAAVRDLRTPGQLQPHRDCCACQEDTRSQLRPSRQGL